MSADLHFSDTVYGLGAGLFFIAYALFGLPSNLMLERIGPRRWIACLMLVWGCLSTAMLLVETARGFYLLRFLLGVAEAGFFPGILVYLNRWFSARRRGQITALFAIAVPMAGVIGGPLSGWILEGFHDAPGLRGWQWMFLIEGLPVVLLGVVVWCSPPESFERVTWLSDEQKHLLREELAGEEQRKTITSFSGIFSNPQVWLLVAIYFAVMLAVNTIAFWMPEPDPWRRHRPGQPHRHAQRGALSRRLRLHDLHRPFLRPPARAPLAPGHSVADGRRRAPAWRPWHRPAPGW